MLAKTGPILLIPVCSDLRWHLIKAAFTKEDGHYNTLPHKKYGMIASKIKWLGENGRNKK